MFYSHIRHKFFQPQYLFESRGTGKPDKTLQCTYCTLCAVAHASRGNKAVLVEGKGVHGVM